MKIFCRIFFTIIFIINVYGISYFVTYINYIIIFLDLKLLNAGNVFEYKKSSLSMLICARSDIATWVHEGIINEAPQKQLAPYINFLLELFEISDITYLNIK